MNNNNLINIEIKNERDRIFQEVLLVLTNEKDEILAWKNLYLYHYIRKGEIVMLEAGVSAINSLNDEDELRKLMKRKQTIKIQINQEEQLVYGNYLISGSFIGKSTIISEREFDDYLVKNKNKNNIIVYDIISTSKNQYNKDYKIYQKLLNFSLFIEVEKEKNDKYTFGYIRMKVIEDDNKIEFDKFDYSPWIFLSSLGRRTIYKKDKFKLHKLIVDTAVKSVGYYTVVNKGLDYLIDKFIIKKDKK